MWTRQCLSLEALQVFVSRLQKFASFYLSRRQRDSAQSQELLGSDGEATPVSDVLTIRRQGAKDMNLGGQRLEILISVVKLL